MSANTCFLYVEDEETSREVMEMTFFYRLGYSNFTIFEDSTDFENRLNNLPQTPDVIFLDIHMEPINGFEILKTVRRQEAYIDTKVIALTASVMNEEVAALESAGFDGTIGKPIDPDVFPELVKKILGGERVWHIS